MAAQDRPSRALRLLQRLTNFWRRRVDAFEVLGQDQWRRLREQGIADERISLVRDGSPIVFSEEQIAEPLPVELKGKCVLLYSGNFGVAHELETVARYYQLHHQHGSGRVHPGSMSRASGRPACRSAVRGRRAVFRSMPVPLERLGDLLSANAHLITLKDAFVGFVALESMPAWSRGVRSYSWAAPDSDIGFCGSQSGLPYWRVACGDAVRVRFEAFEAWRPTGAR
jgi:hypothetical protein